MNHRYFLENLRYHHAFYVSDEQLKNPHNPVECKIFKGYKVINIDHGSCFYDANGFEIFENDIVLIHDEMIAVVENSSGILWHKFYSDRLHFDQKKATLYQIDQDKNLKILLVLTEK